MKNIDFEKGGGLVPAIIQDSRTDKVLMLGFMNEEALKKTTADGYVTFFSRSRNRLWTKGETSGNYLRLVSITSDCDDDSLLVKVVPEGPVCHTGNYSCFGETESGAGFIYELEKIIDDRIASDKAGSYTNKLFREGIKRLAQKVGEEAVELVIEAASGDKKGFSNEAADLVYHLLILLKARGIKFADIEKVLTERHKEKMA